MGVGREGGWGGVNESLGWGAGEGSSGIQIETRTPNLYSVPFLKFHFF